MFYILKGNNGAVYIINTKSWDSISISTKFYNAYTKRLKFLKKCFQFTLFFAGKLGLLKLRSSIDTNRFICNVIDFNYDFDLNENCSALISPTKDKVVVNHHNNFFQKFAFKKSYKAVKNEYRIYNLFKQKPNFFSISSPQNFVDINESCCHFKLINIQKFVKEKNNNMTYALVEFFKTSKLKKVRLIEYFRNLKTTAITHIKNDSSIMTKVVDLENNIESDFFLKLGLVHRDFKPWNVNTEDGIHIYDFEASVTHGLPLEDYFNYFVSPILSYEAPEKILELIFNKEIVSEFNFYLKELKIYIDFKVLLCCYFLERIIFYKSNVERNTRKLYIKLFRKFIEIEHRIRKI